MTTPKGLQFGIFPTPNAASFDEDLRLIRLADDMGLDLVGIQDHPYQRRFLDVFTLMSWSMTLQTARSPKSWHRPHSGSPPELQGDPYPSLAS